MLSNYILNWKSCLSISNLKQLKKLYFILFYFTDTFVKLTSHIASGPLDCSHVTYWLMVEEKLISHTRSLYLTDSNAHLS